MHEALVTFRPPGSAVDEQPIGGEPPIVMLDPLLLLEHTLDIRAYGEALGKALFADQRLALALVRTQERALGARVPLRLHMQLDVDDQALHGVRWELLCDPQRGRFLCLGDQLRLARYMSSADTTPVATSAALPLTALVAVADPSDAESRYNLPRLDAEHMLAQAHTALAGYTVEPLPHATLPALADRLRSGPAVLYLISHGALLEDGRSCFYLEGPDGKAAPATASQVSDVIAGLAARPRLIVLAACQSAGPSAHLGTGLIALGPQMARIGVGAVLAMHDNISVDTVTAGMPVLFDELRRHGSVDRAVTAMRIVLSARADDWWQPVLYLRLREGQLWSTGPQGEGR